MCVGVGWRGYTMVALNLTHDYVGGEKHPFSAIMAYLVKDFTTIGGVNYSEITTANSL